MRSSKVVLINSEQQMAMLHKLMNQFYATPDAYRRGEKALGFTIAGILTELPEILTT